MFRSILTRLRRTSRPQGDEPEQRRELEETERSALEARRQRHAAEARLAEQRVWIDTFGGGSGGL